MNTWFDKPSIPYWREFCCLQFDRQLVRLLFDAHNMTADEVPNGTVGIYRALAEAFGIPWHASTLTHCGGACSIYSRKSFDPELVEEFRH